MTAPAAEERLGVFQQHRGLLFGIAYRMLGTAADAEDALQDAWIRFQGAKNVDSPRALLTTIVSRLCLDRLRSSRHQREVYTGPWLPEPIVEPVDSAPPPEDSLGSRELISYAAMVLLERLAPQERAVFVLSEAFGYSHPEIAATLGITPANSRQLLHRARQRMAGGEQRYTTDFEERRRLTETLLHAFNSGDVNAFASLIADDVVLVSDGGGKRTAALNPIYGLDRVVRFVAGASAKEPAERSAVVLVNGEPGLISFRKGRIQQITALEWADGKVKELRVMRNPDKFTRVEVP